MKDIHKKSEKHILLSTHSSDIPHHCVFLSDSSLTVYITHKKCRGTRPRVYPQCYNPRWIVTGFIKQVSFTQYPSPHLNNHLNRFRSGFMLIPMVRIVNPDFDADPFIVDRQGVHVRGVVLSLIKIIVHIAEINIYLE